MHLATSAWASKPTVGMPLASLLDCQDPSSQLMLRDAGLRIAKVALRPAPGPEAGAALAASGCNRVRHALLTLLLLLLRLSFWPRWLRERPRPNH